MADAILTQCGIYAIRNTTNGHVYVGSSSHVERRIKAHRRLLNSGKHHSIRLQRAWLAHGEDAFLFEIIELVTDVNQLLEVEQRHIESMCAFGKRGYNMLPNAGSTRGFVRPPISDETRAKMSAAHAMQKHDDATKAKISAANKGRKRSAEHCAHMSAINIGRKLSPESIEKRSAKIRGIKHPPYSEERRRNISDALKGRKSEKAIAVTLDGVTYRSMTEAMAALKCNYRALRARIKASIAA